MSESPSAPRGRCDARIVYHRRSRLTLRIWPILF